MQGQLNFCYLHTPPTPTAGPSFFQHTNTAGSQGTLGSRSPRTAAIPEAGRPQSREPLGTASNTAAQRQGGHGAGSTDPSRQWRSPELLTSCPDSVQTWGQKWFAAAGFDQKNGWYRYLAPPSTPDLPVANSPAPNPSSFLFPLCY